MLTDPLNLEAPRVGMEEEAGGFWAERALLCPWPRGRRQIKTNGTVLHQLSQLPIRREPMIRPGKTISAVDFDLQLRHRKENIEALLAQAVGEKAAEECTACGRGNGKFSGCVIVPTVQSSMRSCANCHWGRQGIRCSLFTKQCNEKKE